MRIGDATAERVARAQRRYEQEPGWQLVDYAPVGALLGSIGLQITAPGEATVRHIAVLPPYRGQSIGRKLVEHLIATRQLQRLLAETDRDAVGFSRRCGFVITSLGERYPGVERFRYAWARVPKRSPHGSLDRRCRSVWQVGVHIASPPRRGTCGSVGHDRTPG